ncbi:hypothetical protein J2Z19_003707 [Ensifer adhaerens]|uniref:Uncharacterized protein n=1 Tax=Ensifer adhaerens TaxID=106592 RepID=A0ACC5SYM4_ENSAD|nr:P-loop NTPase fold protein [Ensifer adhaerens]MBP1873988.1 hypothetical protein [Ensifer adhaerens]
MNEQEDIWAEDLLGRRRDAEFLYDFVIGQVEKRKKQGRTGSYVLNIDADWGSGKSFFLTRFGSELERRGHLVAKVNAWQDDHTEDPYIAIMSAIDLALQPYMEKTTAIQKAWSAAKNEGKTIALRTAGNTVKALFKKYVGAIPSELTAGNSGDSFIQNVGDATLEEVNKVASDRIEGLFDASMEQLIERFQAGSKAVTSFRTKLQKTVISLEAKKLPSPVFILVDELDRCRPSFAVQLLERVKHIFEAEGIVFIFATHTQQLRHSVSGFYGHSFDGYKYLKRFFDRSYVFAPPQLDLFVASLCSEIDKTKIRSPNNDIEAFVLSGVNTFNLDLRETKQVIGIVDAAVSAWPHDTKIDLLLLLPLCIAFHQKGRSDWNAVDGTILDGWKLPRTIVDKFTRKEIDKTFYVGRGYRHGVGLCARLGLALDAHEKPKDDITTEYVLGMFDAEWNTTGINRDDPSVLASLPILVGSAGRTS